MRRWVLVLAAAVFALPVFVLAQADAPPPNTVIPPCAAEEAEVVREGTLLSIQVFYDLRVDLGENESVVNLPRLLRRADALQQEWHTIIYPEMPRCALAVEINAYLGRLYDEMVIGLLYIQAGDDAAEDHLELYTALDEAFNAFVARMAE